jgi:hypothetical protein
MGRLALALLLGTALADEPVGPVNPSTPTRRPAPRGEAGAWGWLADPRSAVLLTLVGAAVLGGGRKILQALQARRASERLAEPDVTPAEIAGAARFGREGLLDLFRILGTAEDAPRREAAGRAIAAIWKRDDLIAEEEKALVRRGFAVEWRARRRYPRGLAVPIPIRVEYGVPFLREAEDEVGPNDLAWSHRIAGTQRASLEQPSVWNVGAGHAEFAIDPADFPGNGPHRLALQASARTAVYVDGHDMDLFTGASEKAKGKTVEMRPVGWELDLPHMPFSFELDPNLRVDALLGLADESRADTIGRAVSLVAPASSDDASSRFVGFSQDFLLRDPPVLAVKGPLPCDLAHAIYLEFEGVPGRFAAGFVVKAGQGGTAGIECSVQLEMESLVPVGSIERTGEVRLRAILEADPHRGWADPDIRSIWPGTIVTEWASARVVRR